MHAKQLAEVATWAAFHTNSLVLQTSSLTAESCNQYWAQSKCRQNRWMIALKMFEQDVDNKNAAHNPWPAIEIVVQEIFLSELLTRVWSAAMVAHDQRYEVNELSGIAHSTHIGHLEAKNRAMRLLLQDDNVDAETFDRLNVLRRKVERWTDLLLGQIHSVQAARQFAFDAKRLQDFLEESSESSQQELQTRRILYTASLVEDLDRLTSGFAANPEINRKLAGGLVACFPNDRFDSIGLPKSAQLLWLEKSSDDAQLLLNQLDVLDTYIVPGSRQTPSGPRK